MLIANAILTSMLKILSDLIINHIIGSPAKINKSLQLCFRISCFYHFATESVQNNQNLKIFGRPSRQNLGIALQAFTILYWTFSSNPHPPLDVFILLPLANEFGTDTARYNLHHLFTICNINRFAVIKKENRVKY